jgi:hypothetical protein
VTICRLADPDQVRSLASYSPRRQVADPRLSARTRPKTPPVETVSTGVCVDPEPLTAKPKASVVVDRVRRPAWRGVSVWGNSPLRRSCGREKGYAQRARPHRLTARTHAGQAALCLAYPCLAERRYQRAATLASRRAGTPAKKPRQEMPSRLSCCTGQRCHCSCSTGASVVYWWW